VFKRQTNGHGTCKLGDKLEKTGSMAAPRGDWDRQLSIWKGPGSNPNLNDVKISPFYLKSLAMFS